MTGPFLSSTADAMNVCIFCGDLFADLLACKIWFALMVRMRDGQLVYIHLSTTMTASVEQ
jgi:hypothetical protein